MTAPILVLGATGKTGSRIVRRLTQRGAAVRLGSRTADPAFDWADPTTWPAALDGVRAAYISYFPDVAVPGAVARIADFAEAARVAGVDRLVLLSGRGEAAARAAEDAVRVAGPAFTIVRCAWFAQNFTEGALLPAVLSGEIAMPGGSVREPVLDVDDIADVAVAALTEAGHAGKTYELTGPDLLTFREMTAILATAIGRPLAYRPIGFDDFHAGLAQALGGEMADIVTEIARVTLDGRNAYLTDGVRQALGREPRSFAACMAAAAAAGAWSQAA